MKKPLIEVPADVMRELMRLDEENEALKQVIFDSKNLTFPQRRKQ